MASSLNAERALTAFLDGPDDLSIDNIIHSTAGATAYGFRGPLVGGVTVYGWTVPAILEVLGETWLEDGWLDVAFRRPVYPGDRLIARVALLAGNEAELMMLNQDGERCLTGVVGAGRAPWFEDIELPARRVAEDRPGRLPSLTLASAPVGQDLRPQAVPISKDDAAAYAVEKQHDQRERWAGPSARVHPGWIAGRMTRLLHHSYDYGPSIHTRSQIQHLGPVFAGQTITMAGRMIRAYEQKGHHYAVVDGLMLGEDGRELARLRHTTIFRVAKRS
jgi:acyl dehydratase